MLMITIIIRMMIIIKIIIVIIIPANSLQIQSDYKILETTLGLIIYFWGTR